MRSFLCCAIFCVLYTSATAESLCKPQPTVTQDFLCSLRVAAHIASLSGEIDARTGSHRLADYRVTAQPQIASLYQQALASLQRAPDLQSRLKDVYAAWQVMMDSMVTASVQGRMALADQAGRFQQQAKRLELDLP